MRRDISISESNKSYVSLGPLSVIFMHWPSIYSAVVGLRGAELWNKGVSGEGECENLAWVTVDPINRVQVTW